MREKCWDGWDKATWEKGFVGSWVLIGRYAYF